MDGEKIEFPIMKKYIASGKINTDAIIDGLYTIPVGVYFWSIALRENVTCNRDLYFRLKQTCIDNDLVFGFIQIKFGNILVSEAFGKDMSSYVDKPNGEISVDFKQLIPLQ